MTNINLLPAEHRRRELLEKKESEREKQRVRIDLTNPTVVRSDKIKPPRERRGFGILNLFRQLNFFKRSSKKVSLPPQKNQQTDQQVHPKRVLDLQRQKVHSVPPPVTKPAPAHHKVNTRPVQPASPKEEFNQDRRELYKKIDDSRRKLSQPDKEKISFSSGGEVSNGLSVNLVPDEQRVFYISPRLKMTLLIVVLLVMAAGFAVVFWWFDSRAKADMEQVMVFNQRNDQLRQRIKAGLANGPTVSNLQGRLIEIDKLLDNHIMASKLFGYLEKNTVPGVYFSNLYVDTNVGQVGLDVIALDYQSAAQQILVFEQDKDNVKTVAVNALNLEKEKENKNQQGESFQETAQQTLRRLVNLSIDLEMVENFFINKNNPKL